jgi:hypothetical protein
MPFLPLIILTAKSLGLMSASSVTNLCIAAFIPSPANAKSAALRIHIMKAPFAVSLAKSVKVISDNVPCAASFTIAKVAPQRVLPNIHATSVVALSFCDRDNALAILAALSALPTLTIYLAFLIV